jgi:hypothetical protein
MTDQLWLIALIALAAAILLAGLFLAASVLAGGLTVREVVKWVLLFVAADGNVNRRRLRGC